MRFLTALLILFFITTNVYSGEVYDPAKHGGYQYYQNNYNYTPSSAKENIVIILDASGSMDEQIGGVKKIDIAKRTILKVLSQVSPDIGIGLRVYGGENYFLPSKACRCSHLKVPVVVNSQSQIAGALSAVRPIGATPITYSLKQAVNYDLAGKTGTRRIILLSDGEENCDESPCEYAVNLIRSGSDIKIDAIAFSTNKITDNQLKCVAMSTKGKFYRADTEATLLHSLLDSLRIQKDVQGTIIK